MSRPGSAGEALDRRLQPLIDLRGVRMVSVVDGDGLLIRQHTPGPDAEAVAGHVPVVVGATRGMVRDAALEPPSVIVSESGNGVVLVAPLVMDFSLLVVADGHAVLGSIRYVLRETVPDVNSLLARGYR
jgi:predicted regulator of Ras-like GTPase activity (Roadblock/LC7/MglB family)